MKATKIFYSQCFNTGNYTNQVIGVELEVEEGDTAQYVLTKAKAFVQQNDPAFTAKQAAYQRAKDIVNYPHNSSYTEVEESRKLVADFEGMFNDDLPF